MPTNITVPDTFTLTIGYNTITLPSASASVDVFPDTREAFIQTVRALFHIDGASWPETTTGRCVVVRFGHMNVRVYAPASMQDETPVRRFPTIDAAIEEAVAS